jgi:hypothetical protein
MQLASELSTRIRSSPIVSDNDLRQGQVTSHAFAQASLSNHLKNWKLFRPMHCPEYPTGAKQSLLTSNRHPNGQGLEKSGVQVPTQGNDAPHLAACCLFFCGVSPPKSMIGGHLP